VANLSKSVVFENSIYSANLPFALLVSDLTRPYKFKTARAGQWNAVLPSALNGSSLPKAAPKPTSNPRGLH